MNAFEEKVRETTGRPLESLSLEVLQVNVGLACNQACHHCHLSSSPSREEMMDRETLSLVRDAATASRPLSVDITGGAPEMNPHLPWFIDEMAKSGIPLQLRSNLTALLDKGEDFARFLAERRVAIVASLPCYLEENVDSQRGQGVYRRSIEALQLLNSAGYGQNESLTLTLVYNPGGPFLPPPQEALEKDYRERLWEMFGIVFSRLITITNMPLGRFAEFLEKEGKKEQYMRLLRDAFNPATLDGLMCRRYLSVGWDGKLYDCDFNLALGLPIRASGISHIREFDPKLVEKREIVTGDHCFGCTAGAGSSCAGALV
ncbi:MAG: radical SAM/Cys-rich domain protein [Deltaproteobacteria bacterium]|nr:MAG: radical SAM/Cys-rich domain protein [Deltaproteobacteria bacterium]